MSIHRAQLKNEIHTTNLKWNESVDRQERRRYNDVLKRVVKHITDNCIHDNMKAPLNNNAQPALFAPSSFDIYFGKNLEETRYSHQKMMVRSAYATGSGASSIGLDPRRLMIQHMFPDMAELCNLVQCQVRRHYNRQNEFLMQCDFNHVSVKLYFDGKVTREHTDIEFNKDHTHPTKNNSQQPGTPVAIVTFGDPKILTFSKYKVSQFGSVKTKRRPLKFLQENGSLIVLDPRDEFLNHDSTFWKHRAELVDPKNGVSIALMFRVLVGKKSVKAGTGMDPYAVVAGTGKKKAQLDEAWKDLELNKEQYEQKKQAVLYKIRSNLRKYY